MWRSLSGRLLLLTVVFVMLAEVLIFVPSMARFREEYLRERLEKGQIATLAVLASETGKLPKALERELIENSEVFSVALKRDGARALMLMAPEPMMVDRTYDLRGPSALALIRDALATLIGTGDRYIRIIGVPRFSGGEMVEIVIDEHALRAALIDYALRILQLSLIISAITAGLVFLSCNFFLVRPMRRVIDGIVAFRDAPEDESRVIRPSGASGEIALAERELAETQAEVRHALRQKSRLAALGEAVAKINHDLRNMLSSTQLFADRLEASSDPAVARVAPKLVASVDRAIRLCQRTLEYGSAAEPPPKPAPIDLSALLREIGVALDLDGGEAAGAGPGPRIAYSHSVDPKIGAGFAADPDQLFRALLNLARNAKQALEAQGKRNGKSGGAIRIEAQARDGAVTLDVIDTGPGVPAAARDHLFTPFRGSTSRGGSGLGLAIAAELARGHGGSASLVASDESGSRFRLTLPTAAAPAPRSEPVG